MSTDVGDGEGTAAETAEAEVAEGEVPGEVTVPLPEGTSESVVSVESEGVEGSDHVQMHPTARESVLCITCQQCPLVFALYEMITTTQP